MELLDLPARHLADALRRGESTVGSHLKGVFERIRGLDSYYQAFSQLRVDEALADAAHLDGVPAEDRDGLPLFGVPVAIKEEMEVAGLVTTLGGRGNSAAAPVDSEVVARLKRAGAVIVGKTHMPEFGQAPYTDGAWGATKNPWHADRSPGGSSGGSAVAVATGMVPAALGGDGGGSIRVPAAWTGIAGIKPTRGAVPTEPIPHLWFQLGTFGPLARDFDDVALLLGVIAPTMEQPTAPERLRVGWTLECTVAGIRPDPLIAEAVEHAARTLATDGHDVHRGQFHWEGSPATLLVQSWAGMRDEADRMEHPARLEKRSRQVAALGRLLPDAVVRWALRSNDQIEAASRQVFEGLDILLTAVTPQLPPPTPQLHHLGTVRSQIESTSAVSFTGYWNMAGNPAASVPVGLTPDGLPLAVQVIGAHGKDHLVLDVARRLASTLTPVDRGNRR
ncbi:MAG: amidase family protein [Propionibacteriaceae bacterium]|nr:amidase family protein [Propionibacteriaceae bacterium]